MSYVVIHDPCCLYTKRVASERLCYDETDIYGIMSASTMLRVKDGSERIGALPSTTWLERNRVNPIERREVEKDIGTWKT